MAKTFRITAPDGHVLKITGPDDATEDDALDMAQRMYQPRPPAPETPAARELAERGLADTQASRKSASEFAADPTAQLRSAQERQNTNLRNAALAGTLGAGTIALGAAAGPVAGPLLAKYGPKALKVGLGLEGVKGLADVYRLWREFTGR